LSQQASHDTVSHLLEGVMDFLFQIGELARVLLQQLQPFFGTGLQALLDLGEHWFEPIQRGGLFAFHADLHDVPSSVRKIDSILAFSQAANGIIFRDSHHPWYVVL